MPHFPPLPPPFQAMLVISLPLPFPLPSHAAHVSPSSPLPGGVFFSLLCLNLSAATCLRLLAGAEPAVLPGELQLLAKR